MLSWLFKIRNYDALMKLCEEILEFCEHGDYSNGITGPGGSPDEGEVRASEHHKYLEDKMKNLHTLERKVQDAITRRLGG